MGMHSPGRLHLTAGWVVGRWFAVYQSPARDVRVAACSLYSLYSLYTLYEYGDTLPHQQSKSLPAGQLIHTPSQTPWPDSPCPPSSCRASAASRILATAALALERPNAAVVPTLVRLVSGNRNTSAGDWMDGDRPAASLMSRNLGNPRQPLSVPDVNNAPRFAHDGALCQNQTALEFRPLPLPNLAPSSLGVGVSADLACVLPPRSKTNPPPPPLDPWGSARSASMAGRRQALGTTGGWEAAVHPLRYVRVRTYVSTLPAMYNPPAP